MILLDFRGRRRMEWVRILFQSFLILKSFKRFIRYLIRKFRIL